MELILCGDALDKLRTLDSQSVQTCVTSPPYFALRDYGIDGQIGLEETPKEYIDKLVEVFREVKRVLRPDGTLWLNIADSYAGSTKAGKWREGSARADGSVRGDGQSRRNRNGIGAVEGCKPKDLIGIPWMLAFALRADGWYLRQDIIWNKPNAMPESVRDRCTKSHEHIFLLTKQPRYYFDYEAIKEPAAMKGNSKSFRGGGRSFYNSAEATRESHGNMKNETGTRNKRDVWTIATHPFKEAHFATFPEKLVEPCILAGCPEGGTVLDPFTGSGTTGVVAKKHGRNFIGIELNPEYREMAIKRINETEREIEQLQITI